MTESSTAVPQRGKLRILLGYAAGVGKTYAMLEQAQQRRAQGVNLVVALVDTHNHPETLALLEGLEVIPPRIVDGLPEVDVDAVLARRPRLALVDDLAHVNTPASRHPRRYLDVEDLLNAGIDVYTTLNVQHIESLNDVVARITGVVVHDTLPDRILDEAADIELIDLPPDELMQRLGEGKVHVPAHARPTHRTFFRKGNLTALREMALRRAAQRVDAQMRDYMQTRAIPGPWAAAERLMVCVSSSPLSERLVRTCRRMAQQMDAEWFAVYVELPNQRHLSETDRERLARTLRLVEELGGKPVTLSGHEFAPAVLRYARAHNVTKIVCGKSLRTRWQELLYGDVVHQIIRQSAEIDVYVITGDPQEDARDPLAFPRRMRPLRHYLSGLPMVALITLLLFPLQEFIDPINLASFYLIGVAFAAMFMGRLPALMTMLASVGAFNFFFVTPRYTLHVDDSQYLLTFAGMLAVGGVVSTLASRAREQTEASICREMETSASFALSRALAAAADAPSIASALIRRVTEILRGQVIIYTWQEGQLEAIAATPGFTPDPSAHAAAEWSFHHGQPTGRGSDTLTAVVLRCFPLKTPQNVVGVLGIVLDEGHLLPPQRRLIESFVSQSALALERVQLAEQARKAELLQVSETLQTALLNSISHDLRTPLASIAGALSSLRDDALTLSDAARADLTDNALEETERLNRLVGNLLDMTRLESGALRLHWGPCDVQDLVGVALAQLGERANRNPFALHVAPDLPLVSLDMALITQVLVNLLDNAVKYSPPAIPIEVRASVSGGWLVLEVADRGPGIPPADLTRVFDKFYRVQRPDGVSGTGLGLTICRGIVEVHGGTITAANRPGGGALITVTLPVVETAYDDDTHSCD